MSNASVWAPATSISGNTLSAQQRDIANSGQTVFDLNSFVYAPGTGALDIYKNGLLLSRNVDWVEDTLGTSYRLLGGALPGDILLAIAHVGISAVAPLAFGGSVIQENPPTVVFNSLRWTRCSDMKSFIWYVDGDSAQWVEDNPSYGAHNIIEGVGSPEGVVTATIGKLYINLSGGAGTTLYVKESGAGDTGWAAK